jgi:DNA-binding NtrC family response regulator
VTRHVHVRVIAATNRDLRYQCEQGRFREDLYHRLNPLRITLPPLRDRSSDVPLLFEHFVTRLADDAGKSLGGIDADVLKHLQTCAWPGNVRQVRNAAQQVVNVAEPGERITLAMLTPELRDTHLYDDERPLKEILRHVQVAVIVSRLRKYAYQRGLTADSLGIRRERLWAKMQELGIDVRPSPDCSTGTGD